jgi:hypothetical protein
MNPTPDSIIRRQAGVHPALVDLAFVLAFLFLILSTLAQTNPQQGAGALARRLFRRRLLLEPFAEAGCGGSSESEPDGE